MTKLSSGEPCRPFARLLLTVSRDRTKQRQSTNAASINARNRPRGRMHQLFSSKQLSSRHHVSLSLAIFFLGATLHAQQTTFTVAPSAPTQIAAASPTLNLGVTD